MKRCQYCNAEMTVTHTNRKIRKDKVFCSQACHDKAKYIKASKNFKEFKDEFGLNKYTMRGIQKKLELIEMFGGKCERCGYDKNIAAFDFHHKDGYEKVFEIKVQFLKYKKDDEILAEAMKCMLLCANCHREIHNPYMDIKHVKKVLEEEKSEF